MPRGMSIIAAFVLTLGLAAGCTNMNDTLQSRSSGGATSAGVGVAAGYVKEKMERSGSLDV